MKTLLVAIIISAGFVTGIVDAGTSASTNQSSAIALEMSTRAFKIQLDTFFINLKKKIAPKHEERDDELLLRYFQEHHVDTANPKFAVYLNDRRGFLFIQATPADMDIIEHLVSDITNNK